jgi:SAM-dependent methyltransferase
MDQNSQPTDSMLIDGPRAPIYPLIAGQIRDKLEIKEGTAIDVGTGPASLSIAIARITKLKIYAMDISPEMLQIAQESIENDGLKDRIKPVRGDVHRMPFQDSFADLIFSRGSMFFWKDLVSAFREIHRVLKPGGAGYIGGGWGSSSARKKIKDRFKQQNESYKKPPKIQIDTLEIAVREAGIRDYILINDDSGLWVSFKKDEVFIG